MTEADRKTVSRIGKQLLKEGLTRATGGNVSTRTADETVAISPSGIPYPEIERQDVPVVTMEGEQVSGSDPPSSETPMHTAIYENRPEVGGIVHSHSPYASTFAVLDEPIEGTHYLIAQAGTEIPVAGYAPPGSEDLGRLAAETLGTDYDACLLRNHGVVAVGETLPAALEVAIVVEYVARIHYQALNIGNPEPMAESDLTELRDIFDEYGRH
ncbi:class II aldolase [Halobellus salinus]|uniref:Class II aldolase n=1 Tax=Halobellus salinus TaxID=931585 RepID=A0A830ENG1_9EURY|nr:class II aldolase/adducin family protein [Halobellus salinus]GGJ01617.1 class II aldolase [Halobellus salinus]SMP18363.1 L-fuculose 1-phosphate aldolase [Halobellus salinus]